ncbi:hypothetical protein [Vibrio phage vB_VmeM-Yong XC32]|nr:hypothetical protein [Vibrio phage vB_VmeM-Yong XC31]QAX96499.1 hypothetical protein [Vibrio phage vB_VmeM-Yong XC32]QAX96816.1 hypothetical protein [Vibrio phage vB_VmeM-Yong MS31]QAX97135.1 hypothetical protein [Vibrio phage vB_VmeM-Yong MS32]
MTLFREDVLAAKMAKDMVINHNLDPLVAEKLAKNFLKVLTDRLKHWKLSKEAVELKFPNLGSFRIRRSTFNTQNLKDKEASSEAFTVAFKVTNKFKAAKDSGARIRVQMVSTKTKAVFAETIRYGQLEKVCEAFANVLLMVLITGEGYRLAGLGSFECRSRKNPNVLGLTNVSDRVRVLKFINL